MTDPGSLVEWESDDVAYVASRSEPGTRHRITFADTLWPRCECKAGVHGIECGHVVAVLTEQAERNEMGQPGLRDRLDPPEEQTRAVTVAKRAPVTLRAESVRETLAATRGGAEDALYIAEHIIGKAAWPDDIKGEPNKAALIVMTAAELGVSPIQAFSYITAIKGKPFLMARMVNALVNARVAGGYIQITERSPLKATGVGHRPGRPPLTVTITIEDARRAKWTERNPNYGQNPAAMLAARVTTTIGWLMFADVLAGMDVYDQDTNEAMLAAEVEVLPSGAMQESAGGGQTANAGETSATVPTDHQEEPEADGDPEEAEFREVEDAAPSTPETEPPAEEPAAKAEEVTEFDTFAFIAEVDGILGPLGIEIGKNVSWGTIKVAFDIEAVKPAEIKAELARIVGEAHFKNPLEVVADRVKKHLAA